MDAQPALGESLLYPVDRVQDREGEGPAVGVTQHQSFCGCCGRPQHSERKLWIGSEAVEEMFGIEEHPPVTTAQILDRLGDHAYALVEIGSEHFAHVVVRRLADDANDFGFGGEQRL